MHSHTDSGWGGWGGGDTGGGGGRRTENRDQIHIHATCIYGVVLPDLPLQGYPPLPPIVLPGGGVVGLASSPCGVVVGFGFNPPFPFCGVVSCGGGFGLFTPLVPLWCGGGFWVIKPPLSPPVVWSGVLWWWVVCFGLSV